MRAKSLFYGLTDAAAAAAVGAIETTVPSSPRKQQRQTFLLVFSGVLAQWSPLQAD